MTVYTHYSTNTGFPAQTGQAGKKIAPLPALTKNEIMRAFGGNYVS